MSMSALDIVNLHVSSMWFQNSGEMYVNTPSTPQKKTKGKVMQKNSSLPETVIGF